MKTEDVLRHLNNPVDGSANNRTTASLRRQHETRSDDSGLGASLRINRRANSLSLPTPEERPVIADLNQVLIGAPNDSQHVLLP